MQPDARCLTSWPLDRILTPSELEFVDSQNHILIWQKTLSETALQLQHNALYSSFDRFPSRKGAAIHIDRFARSLFKSAGNGILFVLGDQSLPLYQREEDVEIVRSVPSSANFLERTIEFGQRLAMVLDDQRCSLKICHFRDPWSGVPILTNPGSFATIYEINGLPSIELPYRFPAVSGTTLRKIRRAEEFCWNAADVIITPSETMKRNLIGLGVCDRKISVMPNGADIFPQSGRPDDAPSRYLIYFGALQRWQGVDVLLRAMARLKDRTDLWLVVCGSTHERSAKPYRKLAERLGVSQRVHWLFGLNEAELAPWRSNATLSIAPLTECSRNLDQGCCPLKILESMAAGVPVVASDLPSVRELITDGVDGVIVRPDRPSELAMAIRVLLEYPNRLRSLGQAARDRIEREYTWDASVRRLMDLYQSLLAEGPEKQRRTDDCNPGGFKFGLPATAERPL